MASDSSVDTPALAFLSSLFDPGKLPPAAMALNHSANAFLAGQAFWGPVTATLDWCEVSLLCSRARSALPGRRQWPCLLDPRSPSSPLTLPGQLPVLALHCRGRQHRLQPRHRRTRRLWRSPVRLREPAAPVLGRLRGASSFFACTAYGSGPSSRSRPPIHSSRTQGFALVGIGSIIFHATLLFEAQLMDELPMIYVASYCCAILFDTSRGFSLQHSNAKELGIIFTVFNVLFTWS